MCNGDSKSNDYKNEEQKAHTEVWFQPEQDQCFKILD